MLALLIATIVIGAPLLAFLATCLGDVAEALQHADTGSRREGLRILLACLGFAICVPAAAMAMAIHQRVNEILDCDTLPPPHWRTLRDVRVLRGARARDWAHRLAWCRDGAALLAATSFVAATWAWWRFA